MYKPTGIIVFQRQTVFRATTALKRCVQNDVTELNWHGLVLTNCKTNGQAVMHALQ